MSEPRIPAQTTQHKPHDVLDEHLSIREVYGVLRTGEDGNFTAPDEVGIVAQKHQRRAGPVNPLAS